jgi:hypothetical protein
VSLRHNYVTNWPFSEIYSLFDYTTFREVVLQATARHFGTHFSPLFWREIVTVGVEPGSISIQGLVAQCLTYNPSIQGLPIISKIKINTMIFSV